MKRKTIENRFWEKVDKVFDTNGCWTWKAGKFKDGYGKFRMNGRFLRSHRVAWILKYGSIPEGKQVLHHCDNRACVHDDHLFLGSHQDNMCDRDSKNRQPHNRGHSKLLENQVIQIKELLISGKTQISIAKTFGISQSQISNIRQQKQWHGIGV